MRKKAVVMSGSEPSTVKSEPVALPEAAVCIVKLTPNLDLTTASDLARMILAARGSELAIDASDVQHLGAQCGQILVAAKTTWKADQQTLRIVESSGEFIEGARLLGLQSALQDEDARS